MSHAWISLLVFVAAYSLFVILPNRRSITACTGGLLLVLTGVLGWREAFFEKIGWNVMGLFFGTLIQKKQGHTVGFRQFMEIGVPYTSAAIVPASIFVWLIWG